MWYLLGAKQNFWWQSPEKQRCYLLDTRFKVYMPEVNDRDTSSTMNRLITAQPYYIYVWHVFFVPISLFFTISCSLSPPCSLVLCLFHILCFSSITFLPLPSSSIPPFFALFPCFSECRHGRYNSNMDTSCAWSVGFSFTSWAPVDIQHMFKS